ncbi:MAG: hypothetical protein KME07_05845 [Pegethrix bostrychoides GSE-TBD4-15B]|jgi:hypothetical protein|uniref:Uncharacterized protein n=1 Tax=Pegethrix bostrychoides GSE-TBD4-15B TaxID=2839662 RepID=A0A951P8L3_9CYAN|nr:hypothetical protein [Pegethrix bostrychoides GSE-TBD4-15B]
MISELLEVAKTGVERAMLLQSGYANETDEATARSIRGQIHTAIQQTRHCNDLLGALEQRES